MRKETAVAFLTESERRTVLSNVFDTVNKKFIGSDPDIAKLRDASESEIVRAKTSEDFEDAVNRMLKQLGTSHTGFFHESRPRAAGRIAIAATLMKAETADGLRWVFQKEHPGGVAAQARVLLTIIGRELVPPDAIPFVLGESYTLTVRRTDRSTARSTLTIPGSKERMRPIVVPDQVVTATKLADGIGLVRVSMFPGILGMDVARDISRAISDLACSRMILDLRGNTGGGIGCLRLMSHLCPDRRGVGYSVSRVVAKRGFEKERLPQFDRIPNSKWGVLPLILRFAGARRSVAVFTEALGAQPHHGSVVLLVNEHSASAAEMVAAFASEYGLALLVGTKTAGRLVATSAFKVGFGYRVVLPVAAYYTWQGTNLEGRGVVPDVEEPVSTDALLSARDNQLARAIDCLQQGVAA
jgi:C-terminal processing protease CtpA/Prc